MIETNGRPRCKIERISAPMADAAMEGKFEEVFKRSGILREIQSRLQNRYKEELDHLIWSEKSIEKNLNGVKKEISEMAIAMKNVKHKTSLIVLEEHLKNLVKDKNMITKSLKSYQRFKVL